MSVAGLVTTELIGVSETSLENSTFPFFDVPPHPQTKERAMNALQAELIPKMFEKPKVLMLKSSPMGPHLATQVFGFQGGNLRNKNSSK
jgi:hypothetical protein